VGTTELDLAKAAKSLVAGLSGIEGVICVYLFGSAARGDANTLSDIDLAILLRPDRRGDLSKAMDVLVDVFGEKADVSDLAALPLSIQFRAVRDGVLLYVADDLARARFEVQVMEEYLDMEFHREEYLGAWFGDARSGGS